MKEHENIHKHFYILRGVDDDFLSMSLKTDFTRKRILGWGGRQQTHTNGSKF